MPLVVFLLIWLFPLPVLAQPPKKLTVVIVVDQMRQDQLERYRHLYLPAERGGFLRLAEHGVEHVRAFHDHHPLHTAVGHAAISTGALPSVHGIVGNRWYSHKEKRPTDAGLDPKYPLVGTSAGKTEGFSPRDLLSPTLGDTFKRASGGKAKVITVAHKDRTAVLLGGRASDVCLWYDEVSGNWVSSRFYAPDGNLPTFVKEWNQTRHPDQDFGRIWEAELSPQHPPDSLSASSALRGVAGEYASLGASFPHTIDGGQSQVGASGSFYLAWSHTPWAQHAAVDLALEAVDYYELGGNSHTDLLNVGLASLDKVGHVFGPDSPETLETLLQTDRALARLLDGLEQRVGLENCLIALSSDHGVTPLVEHLEDLGSKSRRIPLAEFRLRLEKKLSQKWQPSDYQLYINEPHLFLVPAAGKEAEKSAMLAALKAELATIEGVKAVFDREDVRRGWHRGTSWETTMARSLLPSRSGDLLLVFEPHTILGFVIPGGTNHGNPWTDDRNVPLLMYGWPYQGVERRTSAPRQLVSTICLTLGFAPPAGCDIDPLPWAIAPSLTER